MTTYEELKPETADCQYNESWEPEGDADNVALFFSKQCTSCHLGYNCRKCLAGKLWKPKAGGEASPVRLVPLSLASESSETKNEARKRSKNRFHVRAKTGLIVAAVNRQPAITFPATESDYSQGMALDMDKAHKHLMRAIRRKYGACSYAWVEHLQGKRERINRHLIVVGIPYLENKWLDDEWHTLYGAKIGKVEPIRAAAGFAGYLTGYLGHEAKFVRARFSQNWIFRGWWQFSKEFHKRWGRYPTPLELAELSQLHGEELRGEAELLLWTGKGYTAERS